MYLEKGMSMKHIQEIMHACASPFSFNVRRTRLLVDEASKKGNCLLIKAPVMLIQAVLILWLTVYEAPLSVPKHFCFCYYVQAQSLSLQPILLYKLRVLFKLQPRFNFVVRPLFCRQRFGVQLVQFSTKFFRCLRPLKLEPEGGYISDALRSPVWEFMTYVGVRSSLSIVNGSR